MSPITRRYKQDKVDGTVSQSGSVLNDPRNYVRDRPKRHSRNAAPNYKFSVDTSQTDDDGHMERSTRKSNKKLKESTPRRKPVNSEFLRNALEKPGRYSANGGVIDRRMLRDQLLQKLRILKGGRRSESQTSGSDLRCWLQNKGLSSLMEPIMRGQDLLHSIVGSVGGFSLAAGTTISSSQTLTRIDESQASDVKVIIPTKSSVIPRSSLSNRKRATLDQPGTSGGLTGNVAVDAIPDSIRALPQTSFVLGEMESSGAGARNLLVKNWLQRHDVGNRWISSNSGAASDAVQGGDIPFHPPVTDGSIQAGGLSYNPPTTLTPGDAQMVNQTDENGSASGQDLQETEGQLQPHASGEQQELPGQDSRRPSESEMTQFCRGVKDDLRSIHRRYEELIATGPYHWSMEVFGNLLAALTSFTWNYMNPQDDAEADSNPPRL